ncbi:hypothetical protein GCM10017608_15080 [Agromyces luteolus]|uniref:DUF1254 domain-containing protein n=1 Tax=Agromyces luteolus TaxID=88373 RepID=A0A7C9LWZ7_9MICO|nr:DUF1254 domain-containing protein [Agromyces luteolus]MUN07799.1 DUF1254 domain-containing protein [Agromyces luteolus]GLK27574.1 hypothetical protein GCM10017608_15080 [Agromyces luteolus]
MAEHVNVDNFARAETNRMLAALAGQAGGTGRWVHNRVPTPVENQPVIRQNRDTLYSMAVVDVSGGASITIPDAGDRYLSVMVVNQDHYIPLVLHEPGEHRLHADELGTQWVVVVPRILVNPDDEADVAAVNALQDAFALDAPEGGAFPMPEYDDASFTDTRNALLTLARGVSGFADAFGRAGEVDPVHHLLGTAAGWGGLPASEAFYVNVEPKLPVGAYALTVRDVPVDAFWSITVYDPAGYMEATDGLVSVNSVTATPNDDGSVTVNFGGPDDGRPNRIGLMDGWNYIVRLYRPRPEVADGTWTFPEVAPA